MTASLLIAVIYLIFISLGLPDSLLGSGWPTMQMYFDVPSSYAGYVSMTISFMTIISALMSPKLISRIHTKWIVICSILLTIFGLCGFSVSSKYWMLFIFAVPYGLGAGAIDSAVNHYVANNYSGSVMNFLHCFYGVGGSSIDRTFFSLFPEFEDLVGNLVVKVLQEVNQHKLTIQLRLLKIINDTASLNNSSVVSNVYTPTIPHLNTYAASRHSGIPIHHVPIISIIIMVFVLPPLLIMPPPRIIFSTLTGAYRANTMSSIFPSSFTLSSTRYNPVYAPAKRMSKADTATPPISLHT